MDPITKCMKESEFMRASSSTRDFKEIKRKTTKAPVLQFLDFDKVFEIACDASNVGIGGVLSQGRIRLYFSSRNFLLPK